MSKKKTKKEKNKNIANELKDIDEQLILANKFNEIIASIISTGNINHRDKLFIIDNSGILQGYMLKFGMGLASFRPPWESYVIKNYQIIANLPSIINSPKDFSGTGDPMTWFYSIRTILSQFIHHLKKLKDAGENYVPKKEEYEKIWLGSIIELENSLGQAIYDQVLKNPTSFHSNTRNISDARKRKVKRDDNYICQICMEKFEEKELEIDHIFPYSLGGSNEIYNLMSICKKCNEEKGNRLEYYRIEEGREKILNNIRRFVKTLDIINDFGSWLKNQGDARHRTKKKSTKKKEKDKIIL